MNDYHNIIKLLIRTNLLETQKTAKITIEDIQDIIKSQGYDVLIDNHKIDRTQLTKDLIDEFSIDSGSISILENQYKKWVTDFKSDNGMPLWEGYKTYLDAQSFPTKELDDYTDKILDRCVDPRIKGEWDRRGMVVGHVQSGKTANFIGLINKAADAGYKLIIVIAGGITTLRKQTQERVDEGFVGSDSTPGRGNRRFGVSIKSSHKRNIYSFTTRYTKNGKDGDLNQQSQERLNIPLGESPTVFVIKKNKSVLENIIDFIGTNRDVSQDSNGYPILKNVPALIIDDEADSFSVNASKDINDIKTINRLIRVLLNQLEQSTFIGYTATPYANIFIPQEYNESLTTIVKGNEYPIGKDLFPEDFIININPPSNYIGAIQMFGHVKEVTNEEIEPLPLFRKLEETEFLSNFPKVTRANQADLPEEIPNSLKNAIKAFFLVCAIRRVRGDENKHNSMLVHVIQYVSWINRIALIVDETLLEYKNLVIGGDKSFIDSLEKLYSSDFKPTTEKVLENLAYNDSKIRNHSWQEVRKELRKAVERIEVRAVHGKRKDLEFEKYEDINYSNYDRGANIIAVGGTKLSRGVTLEGLSISYYLRNTKTYDSLMQMGRWFGYRNGYADLCRLYTTGTVFEWFNHVTLATEEMREEFDNMVAKNLKPKEYQLKVRSHSGLLSITSTNKLYHSEEILVSFSNSHLQTYSLSTNPKVIHNNFKRYKELFRALPEPDEHNIVSNGKNLKYILFKNTDKELISKFLDSYVSTTPKITNSNLGEYITKQENIKWNVIFRGSDNRTTKIFIPNEEGNRIEKQCEVKSFELISRNGTKYQLNRTTRNPSNAHEKFIAEENYTLIKNNINTPSDRFLDLPEGFQSKKGRGEKQEGLIIFYALDERVLGESNIPIIGFSLSVPSIENEVKSTYRANILIDHEEIENPDDEDTEE